MNVQRLTWIGAILVVGLSLMVGCRFGGGEFDGNSGDDDSVIEDDDTGDDDTGDDDAGDDDSSDDDVGDDDDFGTPFDPPSIYGAVVGYDDGRLFVYGGATAVGGGAAGDELWVLSETDDGFAALSIEQSGDAPPALVHAVGGYDAVSQSLLVYGGQTADGTEVSGSWRCDLSTDPATWNVGAQGPGARTGATGVIATVGDRRGLVVFGGKRGDLYLNDLWVLLPPGDGGGWQQVTTSGFTTPAARAFHAMIYDPGQKALWVFGGEGADGFFDDTWKFNARSGALRWVQFPTQTPRPSGRIGMSAAMDAENANAVFFGGGNSGYDDNLYALELNPGSQFWFRPEVTGQKPTGRRFAQMAWDEAGGRFWIYGGLTADAVAGDLWTISATDLDQWTQGTFAN